LILGIKKLTETYLELNLFPLIMIWYNQVYSYLILNIKKGNEEIYWFIISNILYVEDDSTYMK